MALRATAAGQLLSLNTQAREGEIAFGVLSNAGEVINLRMPCECEVRQADRSFQGVGVSKNIDKGRAYLSRAEIEGSTEAGRILRTFELALASQ